MRRGVENGLKLPVAGTKEVDEKRVETNTMSLLLESADVKRGGGRVDSLKPNRG